jgi:hypothetical protein
MESLRQWQGGMANVQWCWLLIGERHALVLAVDG